MDCRHGREEGTCPRRALTPNHSREFYSQVSRFESKAFTNYSPEFHSHPNTKIQNFNSHSPEFHSQKTSILAPKIIQLHVPSIFFSSIFTRFILSYLNSSSSIVRNKRNILSACARSFFPKIFPLFDGATRFLP